MSDDKLRFPPVKRRETSKFQPPPWESDQFEQLAKTSAEQESPAQGKSAQMSAPEVAAEQDKRTEALEVGAATPGEGETAEQRIDEQQLTLMMLGLRAEEPRAEDAYWKVTMIAGVVSALIGLVMTTWAVAAYVKLTPSGAQGIIVSTMLLVVGLAFVAGGIWLVVKTLRQQGVL